MRLPYFQFYVNDWLSGKLQFLPMECHGVFANLCAMIWKSENHLENDEEYISHMLRVDKQMFNKCLNLLKQKEIVYLDKDNLLRVEFLDEQWEAKTDISQKRSKAGRKGGKQKLSKCKANDKQLLVSSESESEQESDKPPIPPKGKVAVKFDMEKMLSEHDNINTEKFRQSWKLWEQFRKEKKKPLTQTSVKLQLRECSKIGEQRAIAMIENTIFKGWEGLKEPTAVFNQKAQRVIKEGDTLYPNDPRQPWESDHDYMARKFVQP